MCLIIFLCLLFGRTLAVLYEYLKSKVATNDADDNDVLDKDVEENIDFYWRSLEGSDQKNMYADEVYKRNKFGIKGLSDAALEILRTTDRRIRPKKAGEDSKKAPPKYIHGDSTYDMLTNIEYQQAFQYQTLDMRNQKEDFEMCDMITQALHIDPNVSKPDTNTVQMNNKTPFKGSFGILVDQN